MLSRVAETLYWTARYLERAENIARLVNINNMLLMDLPKGVSAGWEPLIDIIGGRKDFEENYSDYSERSCLRYFLIGATNPSSILNVVSYARENARTVRDVIPRDVWEGINTLYHYIKENQNEGLNKRGRFKFLKDIIETKHLIFGALDASITHDDSYKFIRIGALIERADMTSRILDVRSASLINSTNNELTKPFDNIQWISVLRSLSAYQMYRKEMGIRVQRADVIEFMLHNETFPRSFFFCLNSLKDLAKPIINSTELVNSIEQAIDKLSDKDVRSLRNEILHEYIDQLQLDLVSIHSKIAELYFLCD